LAQAAASLRPFSSGLRSPIIAPVTRGLIAIPLFFLSTQTDKYFAWTIVPNLSAAVLGANYLASTFLALGAFKKTYWAHARVSISVALVFAPITTAATLMHIDKFHLDTFYGWFWVVAYTIYPPQLAYLTYRQFKLPGGDPPREHTLPGWIKVLFGVHAVIMIPVGLLMFVSPATADKIWPWALTPLTSRALSAWVLAFGVMAAHCLLENDLERAKVGLYTYPILGLFQVIALARFAEDMQWDEVGAWIYVFLVATTFVFGFYGLLATRGRAIRTASAEP
jgi:hypothetical protein